MVVLSKLKWGLSLSQRWYHFCVSYNGEESLYRLYFEGEMVGELESEVHRVAQGDEFFVGLSMKGGPSFHGELTQVISLIFI